MNLQRLLDRASGRGYPFLLALIAAVDYVLFLVPMTPLTIASVAIVPRNWIRIALAITLGSWIGAMGFEIVVAHQGIPLLQWLAPRMLHSHAWELMQVWIGRYGFWALFVVALSPTVDHPIVALAGLSKLPVVEVALVLLAGKAIKYFFFAWCGANAPGLLRKLKIIKK